MSESAEKGNFIAKLHAFFLSCILAGWKDSIVTLHSTAGLSEWSENLGITRKCIDSIVEKILTPPAKVNWSYTYTRPGYSTKNHRSVPKDWWTEDVADLDIDLFRCIILAVSSTYLLPPPLIGEALHVYAYRWLPDTSKPKPPETSISQTEENLEKNRRILETIISLIPPDRESVSVGFLLRLLSLANYLGASPVTKTEVIRRSSMVLEDATVSDLLFPSHSASDEHFYDIDLVLAVLESFLSAWRRQSPAVVENSGQLLTPIRKIGKLIDSYLNVVARDRNMPVSKMIYLAEAFPDVGRPNHDDIYKAINVFLKEHPDLSKVDKKRLCRILNCQKLSPEVRAHAVKNERLPLRTVVQVLFFEQEKGLKVNGAREPVSRPKQRPSTCSDEKFRRSESVRRVENPETSEKMKKSESRKKVVMKGESEDIESEDGKRNPSKLVQKGSRRDHFHRKSRDK